MADSPYPQSRAALRKIYGSRAIDASTKYSERDTTPSAREARAIEGGATKQEAAQIAAEKFRDNFSPQPQIQAPPVFSRRAAQIPNLKAQPFAGGFASPDDVRSAVTSGGQGTLMTPYGPATLPKMGLLPPSNPIGDLGEFMPSSVGPLSSFALPKPPS